MHTLCRFMRVDYKCRGILEKHSIESFPTCLVFVGSEQSNDYKPIIGNSPSSRDELQFIVDKLSRMVSNPELFDENGHERPQKEEEEEEEEKEKDDGDDGAEECTNNEDSNDSNQADE